MTSIYREVPELSLVRYLKIWTNQMTYDRQSNTFEDRWPEKVVTRVRNYGHNSLHQLSEVALRNYKVLRSKTGKQAIPNIVFYGKKGWILFISLLLVFLTNDKHIMTLTLTGGTKKKLNACKIPVNRSPFHPSLHVLRNLVGKWSYFNIKLFLNMEIMKSLNCFNGGRQWAIKLRTVFSGSECSNNQSFDLSVKLDQGCA